jgi:hypothetical protein
MDLIGSVNYIDKNPGGHKPNQERGKSGQKNSRKTPNLPTEKNTPSAPQQPQTEYDSPLGRKIDTTA